MVVLFTAELLQLMTPPFGQLVEKNAELEGTLRSTHNRIITNSEEIAFYRGHRFEKTRLVSDFSSLVRHVSSYLWTKVPYHMLQGFLMKYTWGAFGLIMCAVPVFASGQLSTGTEDKLTARATAQNTGDLTTTRLCLCVCLCLCRCLCGCLCLCVCLCVCVCAQTQFAIKACCNLFRITYYIHITSISHPYHIHVASITHPYNVHITSI